MLNKVVDRRALERAKLTVQICIPKLCLHLTSHGKAAFVPIPCKPSLRRLTPLLVATSSYNSLTAVAVGAVNSCVSRLEIAWAGLVGRVLLICIFGIGLTVSA